MKLSFSTLGCPDWSLDKTVANAKLYGFEGVELRGVTRVLDIRQLSEFSDENIEQTRKLFSNAGISIVSVDSSASFSHQDADKLEASVKEAKEYIELASKLQAPMVRVFGGFIAEDVTLEVGMQQLADNLAKLGDYAEVRNVIVALETHDSFLTGKIVSEVMQMTNNQSIGVVWDISNCFWTGEPIEQSAELLAPYIKLVHVKDTVLVDKEAKHRFIGDGDIPNQKALKLLANQGYDGFLSYEWEKVWQPDIAEPEQAFPQYITKMTEYLANLA
ncbi:MAG: sugar phosphate isomerase/epimerase [Planctomycetes bacterium]|nr:sugar phosphate isomerase/epimerase [Planctomycetota bacterium]